MGNFYALYVSTQLNENRHIYQNAGSESQTYHLRYFELPGMLFMNVKLNK